MTGHTCMPTTRPTAFFASLSAYQCRQMLNQVLTFLFRDLATRNLAHLSSQQALADTATFISFLRIFYSLNETHKLILFGESYAGRNFIFLCEIALGTLLRRITTFLTSYLVPSAHRLPRDNQYDKEQQTLLKSISSHRSDNFIWLHFCSCMCFVLPKSSSSE